LLDRHAALGAALNAAVAAAMQVRGVVGMCYSRCISKHAILMMLLVIRGPVTSRFLSASSNAGEVGDAAVLVTICSTQ
jgi:hypothetical protein